MGRKNALNFAKFHARGGRGLQPTASGIGVPLPPAQPRRGGWPGGHRRLPGRGGRGLPRRAGYRTATRAAARGYTGRIQGAAATAGQAIPGGGATGAHQAATGARAATPAGGRRQSQPVPGRGYTGARLPRRGARRHTQPVPGRLPGGATGAAGYPGGLCRAAIPGGGRATPAERIPGGAKKFFAGRGYRGKKAAPAFHAHE